MDEIRSASTPAAAERRNSGFTAAPRGELAGVEASRRYRALLNPILGSNDAGDPGGQRGMEG